MFNIFFVGYGLLVVWVVGGLGRSSLGEFMNGMGGKCISGIYTPDAIRDKEV